jgi:hypothetical protein
VIATTRRALLLHGAALCVAAGPVATSIAAAAARCGACDTTVTSRAAASSLIAVVDSHCAISRSAVKHLVQRAAQVIDIRPDVYWVWRHSLRALLAVGDVTLAGTTSYADMQVLISEARTLGLRQRWVQSQPAGSVGRSVFSWLLS